MKANLPDEQPGDAQLDPNDPVWQLLERAPMRKPDAWFVARTLARCRHASLSMEPGWFVLGRIWRWALGGGVGISLALALIVPRIHSVSMANNRQKNVQEAFEIVASLGTGTGTDSDSSSNTSASSWQDSSL